MGLLKLKARRVKNKNEPAQSQEDVLKHSEHFIAYNAAKCLQLFIIIHELFVVTIVSTRVQLERYTSTKYCLPVVIKRHAQSTPPH